MKIMKIASGGAVAILALVAAVLAFTFLSGQGGEPPAAIDLVGVTDESKIAMGLDNGISFSMADRDSSKVTAAEAESTAYEIVGGATSRQTVLAQLDRSDPDDHRLVWVVNLDPDSIETWAGTDEITYAHIVVVDANSGEWLFGLGSWVDCSDEPDNADCIARGLPKTQ